MAHVLWTGGFDSTFRVLQLAVGGRVVQPHYLIDLRRRSTLQEFNAMHRIRRGLERMDSEAAARIKPTTFAVAQEVPADSEGTAKLARLRERGTVVRQYDFITAYAAHVEAPLEMGLIKDDSRTVALLDGMMEYVEDYWRIDRSKVSPDDDLSVFSPFRFPLLTLSKVEMLTTAEAMGLRGLMHDTWVCRRPLGSDRDTPCGRCSPCRDIMQQGMRHRFGASSRVRYHLRIFYALARPLRLRYQAMTARE